MPGTFPVSNVHLWREKHSQQYWKHFHCTHISRNAILVLQYFVVGLFWHSAVCRDPTGKVLDMSLLRILGIILVWHTGRSYYNNEKYACQQNLVKRNKQLPYNMYVCVTRMPCVWMRSVTIHLYGLCFVCVPGIRIIFTPGKILYLKKYLQLIYFFHGTATSHLSYVGVYGYPVYYTQPCT